jgi:hypothetical protein
LGTEDFGLDVMKERMDLIKHENGSQAYNQKENQETSYMKLPTFRASKPHVILLSGTISFSSASDEKRNRNELFGREIYPLQYMLSIILAKA